MCAHRAQCVVMSATVPVQQRRQANPMAWQTAESWIEGRNKLVETSVKGFDYCRVGRGGVKHRLTLVSHADGRISIEPACSQPYFGESVERVQVVSSHAEGEFCKRLACVYDTPARRAPKSAPTLHPRQLELDLTI